MRYSFRPAAMADEPFLWDMLYEALYIPAGEPLPPRAILQDPKLAHYVAGWGTQSGDLGVLACDAESGEPIGAAWLRLLPADDPGWGFVDAGTPELSMAIRAEHRGRGVGNRLLDELLAVAAQKFAAVSLSVDPHNVAAMRLYERLGFVVIGEAGTSLTMHKVLANSITSTQGRFMQAITPETQGFSSERLARIAPVMQRYADQQKLAGISTLVTRRGQVVHSHTCGMADIEAGKPMSADTIFRIYSMTKPITSVAVLMLLEEAWLRLTDPVADYLPAFGNAKVLERQPDGQERLVDARKPITVHQLLTHTAGLSYGSNEFTTTTDEAYDQLWDKLDNEPNFTLDDWAAALAAIPLLFQPGTRYQYSMATDVLGALVQAVSGQPFAEFLQQRILAPLGMVDTAFEVPAEKLDRFAANYGPVEGGGLRVIDAAQTSKYAQPTSHPSGGGGLVSTIGDYWRFTQMLLNHGELDGVRLLGRKTVELMTTNALPAGVYLNNDPALGAGFGLGVSILQDVGKVQQLGSIGSYGWGGAANTNFWVDPKEALIGIIMLQFMPSDTYPVVVDFRNLVYQALVA